MAGKGLHVLHFLFGLFHGSIHDGLEEVVNSGGVSGHLVGKLEIGKGAVSEEGGHLCTQFQDFKDDGVVVVLISIVAAH